VGRQYDLELEKIDLTYEHLTTVAIDEVSAFVSIAREHPLLSIGSGGSFTSAVFASLLHQHAGNMAMPITPLEIVSLDYPLNKMSLIFLSAGGSNSDLLISFHLAVREEPRNLMVLCATRESSLKKIAKDYHYVDLFEFESLAGRDGFLATNSMLGFVMLLTRAYRDYISISYEIPKSLDSLVHPHVSRPEFLEQLSNDLSALVGKDTIITLYGKWGKPAAIDIESKFTEAALGNVQLADYRNFAHGRHNWLDKERKRTGLLALITADDRKLASSTLALVPQDIPVVRLFSESPGPIAAVSLLIKTLYTVGIIGKAKGIDPGRPKITLFGRRIYSLRMPIPPEKKLLYLKSPSLKSAAILRKIRAQGHLLKKSPDIIQFWTNAHQRFVEKMEEARYGSIVLDYDGTLCDPRKRFSGLSEEVSKMLVRLLEKGAMIGVATGRGKSVRDDLRRAIPTSYWGQILVGYYNGSDIGLLQDETHPNRDLDMNPGLKSLELALKDLGDLQNFVKYECRPNQITFETAGLSTLDEIVIILSSLVRKSDIRDIKLLRSSHTVDFVASKVSKLSLVKMMMQTAGNCEAPVLCIGDKGEWPGNDFELLGSKYSLSVDEISSDPETCWNLAPFGHRNVQATMDYLRAIVIENGLIYFTQKRIK
jgi:hydroxymethylpyrimidine pyrophosphatase-like HAD family hydrolase